MATATRAKRTRADADSVRLAERVIDKLGGRHREGVTITRSDGDQEYVRLARDGHTVAYVQSRPRAGHELALLRGDPQKIAAALPDGRDPYTRVFSDGQEARAARAVRAALEKNAPARKR